MSNRVLELIILFTFIIIFIVFTVLPELVYAGTKQGLSTWWKIILPSLLPFFILSNLLIKMGVIHFLGTFLEPLMRPLFNIPGPGAFALILGMTSGAPVNASIASQLRKSNILTVNEGERLIAFTSNSSLLFMVTAISVGMLQRPELGVVIAGIHYTSNIIIGVFLGQLDKKTLYSKTPRRQSIRYAITSLVTKAKLTTSDYLRFNYRGFNKTIYSAVTESMVNILNIGGYIVLFSVLTRLISETDLNQILFHWQHVLSPYAIDEIEIFTSLLTGIFETTVGSEIVSESSHNLHLTVTVILLILGWGGLSIHAQVMTVIADTDLSLITFLLTRIGQGLISIAIFHLFSNYWIVDTETRPVVSALNQIPSYVSIVSILIFVNCFILIILLVFSLLFVMANQYNHFN